MASRCSLRSRSCADLFTRFGGHAFAVGFALPLKSSPTSSAACATTPTTISPPASPSVSSAFMPNFRSTASRPFSPGGCASSSLGHGNPEPIFIARSARLLAPPRIMKAQHLRLELAQDSAPMQFSFNFDRIFDHASPGAHAEPPNDSPACPPPPRPSASIRAVGWNLAQRAMELRLAQGSLIDIAYRIRENDHPDFGGLEIEIVGLKARPEPTLAKPRPHL